MRIDVKLQIQLNELIKTIENNRIVKHNTLSLVPTENQMSDTARAILSSDLAHRYLLLESTVWEYPQFEELKKVQDLCIKAISELYEVPYVNVRPLSGISAMLIVLAAMTKPGDTLYTISPEDGGHGATKSIATRLGLQIEHLPFDRSSLDFDLDSTRRMFSNRQPNVIYLDFSNILFPVSLSELVQIAPDNAFIYFDCSQLLGLMADPMYFNPLNEGCVVTGGSTHKTFPGPQKGIVFGTDASVMERIQKASETFVSNNHMNCVAALAISALEMSRFGYDYSHAVRDNAQALARLLVDRSVPVLGRGDGDYTHTHQVWISGGEDASEPISRLKEAGIIVNAARIPILSGMRGIRIGTTEVSRLGMGKDEMAIIADCFADAFHARFDPHKIRTQVQELKRMFPETKYCFEALNMSPYDL